LERYASFQKQINCLELYASFQKQIKTKKTNKNTKRIVDFRISIFHLLRGGFYLFFLFLFVFCKTACGREICFL